MTRSPFDQDAEGLALVLGSAASDPSVVAVLHDIDAQLRAFTVELEIVSAVGWRTCGLTLDAFPGPPRKRRLGGYVESADVTFWLELSRGDFYANYAQLSRVRDHYYVEADVYVVSEASVSAGNELVMELPPRESADPADAVMLLAGAFLALRDEATRRPPTATAWRAV